VLARNGARRVSGERETGTLEIQGIGNAETLVRISPDNQVHALADHQAQRLARLYALSFETAATIARLCFGFVR